MAFCPGLGLIQAMTYMRVALKISPHTRKGEDYVGPRVPENIFGEEKEAHKLHGISKQTTWAQSCPLGSDSSLSPPLWEGQKE